MKKISISLAALTLSISGISVASNVNCPFKAGGNLYPSKVSIYSQFLPNGNSGSPVLKETASTARPTQRKGAKGADR